MGFVRDTLLSKRKEEPSSQTRLSLPAQAPCTGDTTAVALGAEDTRGDVNHLPSLACVWARMFKSGGLGRRLTGREGTIRRYYPKLQTYPVKQAGSALGQSTVWRCTGQPPPLEARALCLTSSATAPPHTQAIGEGSAVPPEGRMVGQGESEVSWKPRPSAGESLVTGLLSCCPAEVLGVQATR